MAFPSATTLTQAFASAATSHSVGLPATVADGDLLLIQFTALESVSDVTPPEGWTVLSSGNVSGAGVASGYIVTKIGEASDSGTSAQFSLTAAGAASAIVYKITGWSGSLSDIEAATAATSGDIIDCPSLSPSWGLADNLWLTFISAGDDDGTVTGYPTLFTDGVQVVSGAGMDSGTTCGSASKQDAVSTIDPGNFTLSEAEATRTFTVVVRPSGVLNSLKDRNRCGHLGMGVGL